MNAQNLKKQNRLIIVSNRLPFTVEEHGSEIKYLPSSGGLATGLGSFFNESVDYWIGWPGKVSRVNFPRVSEYLRHTHKCEPVFLSERLVEKFYEGYSNRTLWPLFHSFQSYAKYSASEWQCYQEANSQFMQTLDSILQPGDKVWIHDYQLMLLPKLLRERHPEVSIGFFLHIPFPSFELYQLLPQNREILESLLSCDLIGFHTNDYAKAFCDATHRLFGLQDWLGEIQVGNHVVKTIVHPMSIDFKRFSDASTSLTNAKDELKLLETLGETQLIFSVSRLDYTKGILQMIEAYEYLLEKKESLRGKITFVLCVVPSREKVERYAQLKRKIDESVGRINAKYGQVGWAPVQYIYRSLSFDELVLLYKHTHVCLITPLRDGLNLIAKEYVASRNNEKGVLVLSEFAGAAKELLEALIVNPNNREELAKAIFDALSMTEMEQLSRMRALRERLLEAPIQNWGAEFLQKLDHYTEKRIALEKDFQESHRIQAMIGRSKLPGKKLFLLDYDGTLMPLMSDRAKVTPDHRLHELLSDLASDRQNEVILLSGRSRAELDKWFSGAPFSIAAEHGAWRKDPLLNVWRHIVGNKSVTWKPEVRESLEYFVDNIPGSSIEEKEFSMIWHYRRSDVVSADLAAKDLILHLANIVGEHSVRIVPGNKSVEVRCMGVGKGSFVKEEIDFSKYELVIAAGDDVTDEDLFKACPRTAYTIKTGPGHTCANIRVRDHLELRRILADIAQSSEDEMINLNTKGC